MNKLIYRYVILFMVLSMCIGCIFTVFKFFEMSGVDSWQF